MNIKWLVIVGIFAAAIASTVLIPASVIEPHINKQLNNAGTFRVTNGTIWSGAATLNLTNQRQNRTPQMEALVQWSFAPMSLLTARLGFDITLSGADINGRTRVGLGLASAKFSATDIATTFEVVNRFSPFMQMLRASGEVQLQAGETPFVLSYAAPHNTSGTLKASATKLRIRTFGGDNIGRFAATLTFDKQNTAFKIDDSNGLLTLDGGGTISRGNPRSFRYVGTAKVSRNTPAWLSASLIAVGRPSLDGRIQIDYQTKF